MNDKIFVDLLIMNIITTYFLLLLAWGALHCDGCGGSDATPPGDLDPKPSSVGRL